MTQGPWSIPLTWMPPRYTFLYQSIHNEHFSTLVFNLCCSVSAHIRHFRREVRPVLPSTHWPQHSWPQPPTRMQPCGAAWGGKGGGPGIGGPKGRSFWMLLQPHWHDWTGTAETHWCEYISFDVKAYFGYFNSWDVLFTIWLCWTVNALNGVDSKLFLMLAWLRSIFSLTSQFHHCSLHQGWPGTGRMLVASGRIRFEEYQVHKPNQSPLFSSRPIFLSSEYYWVHLKQCSNFLLYPSAVILHQSHLLLSTFLSSLGPLSVWQTCVPLVDMCIYGPWLARCTRHLVWF